MIKIYKLFTCLLLVGFISIANAQYEGTLYFMQAIPQSAYGNPAQNVFYNSSLSLPGISSNYVGLGNSGFRYNQLVKRSAEFPDSLELDFNGLSSVLGKRNLIRATANIDLFNVYFRSHKGNGFMLNITEKIDTRMMYPKGLIDFAIQGNGSEALLGKTINLAPSIDFVHYREVGILKTFQLSRELTIGIRPKVLFGMSNVNTRKMEANLTTSSSDNFAWTIGSKVDVNTSGYGFVKSILNDSISATLTEDDYIAYATNFKNWGLGIDLGATYALSQKLVLGAALNDVGFIRWRTDVTNFESSANNKDFTFAGISDFNAVLNNPDSVMKILADSIVGINEINEFHQNYSTSLTSKLYLSARYELARNLFAGAVFQGTLLHGRFFPSASLVLNKEFGKIFSLTLSQSTTYGSLYNLGAGISFNLSPFQLYVVSDNMISVPTQPTYTNNASIRVGFNLIAGHRMKKQIKSLPRYNNFNILDLKIQNK